MAGTCDETGHDGALWNQLSYKQCLAISALVNGASVYEASLAAGVRSRATLYRWLRKPYFVAALRRVREERQRPFVELKKLVDDPATEAHIRVRAAEDLRDMVREPERDAYFFGDHDTRVAKSILSVLS